MLQLELDRKLQTFTRSYFAAIIGVELMYVGIVVFGSIARTAAALREFTGLGIELFRPERELPIYLLGILGTIALSLGVERLVPVSGRKPVASAISLMKCFVATCGAACFIAACAILPVHSGPVDRLTIAGALILLAIIAITWTLALWFNSRSAAPPWLSRLCSVSAEDKARSSNVPPVKAWGIADFLIVAALMAIVYIPNCDRLASADFRLEQLHHWDFFLMGPAIGYLHGGGLGSQVYSQYGVGYPVLVASLARWVPLTYPNLMRLGILFGCAYFAGLYVLLRSLTRSRSWALFGVLLAISVLLFHGIESRLVIWQFPSSTPMRSPFDVWLFALLLQSQRSGGRLALFCASVMAGLAVLAETDTGIYLGVALTFYCVLIKWKHHPRRSGSSDPSEVTIYCVPIKQKLLSANLPQVARAIGSAIVPAAAVAIMGLVIAARGNPFTGQFLTGWLEVYRLYPSGIGMLPITISAAGLATSFAFAVVYLSVLICQLNLWRHNEITKTGALLASVAVFGLCYLCQFIGRSHPDNLYHCCISMVILSTVFAKTVVDRFSRSDIQNRAYRTFVRVVPALLTTCVIANALTTPGFWDYPNLLHPTPKEPTGSRVPNTLQDTGIELPTEMHAYAADFTRVTSDAERVRQAGRSVFFLVNNDPIYYLASGAQSRFRYSPLIQCLLTRSAQLAFEDRFLSQHIDYVYVAPAEPAGLYGDAAHDVRESLLQVVQAHYRLVNRCGSFEVWRRL